MAALFLRGGPGGGLPRRHWPAILSLLRREGPDLDSVRTSLERHGLWEAGLLLGTNGVLERAGSLVRERRCITVACDAYPRRLLSALGRSAPPAIWCIGDLEPLKQESASVVGCRRVSGRVAAFAYRAGKACAEAGTVLVSGGATGCDRLAEAGAARHGGACVRWLPHGVVGVTVQPGLTVLSVCAPSEEFSTAAAMERNALIYAMSPRALVVHSRFREGGTWHGATDALRRRLTTVFYRETPDLWARAFKALGARPVLSPAEFLCEPVEEVAGGLFELG